MDGSIAHEIICIIQRADNTRTTVDDMLPAFLRWVEHKKLLNHAGGPLRWLLLPLHVGIVRNKSIFFCDSSANIRFFYEDDKVLVLVF